MTLTAGVDVGSSAVKTVLVRHGDGGPEILGRRIDRLRHRDPADVAREGWTALLGSTGVRADEVSYVATTGEGERVEFRTGHFYGMTAHARGGAFLVPGAAAVLDVGALHCRAIVVDGGGRVQRYRMTSQCASGSGQFIENISRYLGLAIEEVGEISLKADQPEVPSGICAVLAETDVINMVSRGLTTADILRGIHDSIAGRLVRLAKAAGAEGRLLVTGGLSRDEGLLAALADQLGAGPLTVASHPDAIFAGALGAALLAAYRYEQLERMGRLPAAASA